MHKDCLLLSTRHLVGHLVNGTTTISTCCPMPKSSPLFFNAANDPLTELKSLQGKNNRERALTDWGPLGLVTRQTRRSVTWSSFSSSYSSFSPFPRWRRPRATIQRPSASSSSLTSSSSAGSSSSLTFSFSSATPRPVVRRHASFNLGGRSHRPLKRHSPKRANSASSAYAALASDIFAHPGGQKLHHAIWQNDDAVAHSSISPLTVGDDGGACGGCVPGED